jgi:hypothetical protein
VSKVEYKKESYGLALNMNKMKKCGGVDDIKKKNPTKNKQ